MKNLNFSRYARDSTLGQVITITADLRESRPRFSYITLRMVSELFTILQSYGEQLPSAHLKWPYTASCSAIQEFLLYSVLESSHFRSFPPSMRSQRGFWKWVIERLEEAEEASRICIYQSYILFLRITQ